MIFQQKNGISVIINKKTDFLESYNNIETIFNYKLHRYIHIDYQDTPFFDKLYSFINALKDLPVIVIFESKLPQEQKFIDLLYASGVDVAIFLMDNANEEIIAHARLVFSSALYLINDLSEKEDLIKKLPFVSDNSIFESVKRKIWIDISNLKRRLRVKEISESYDSAGL